jgi:hypothetical protein
MIWYLGLDGLGGIDLENEEDDNVRIQSVHLTKLTRHIGVRGQYPVLRELLRSWGFHNEDSGW